MQFYTYYLSSRIETRLVDVTEQDVVAFDTFTRCARRIRSIRNISVLTLCRRLNQLDDLLRNFSNSARLLGSSVDILSSTYHLRERLTAIRYLFRENAAHLFPNKVTHAPEESLHRPAIPDRRRSQSRAHTYSSTRRIPILDPPVHEDFPKELEFLARDTMTFLLDFNDFLDYPDEAVSIAPP